MSKQVKRIQLLTAKGIKPINIAKMMGLSYSAVYSRSNEFTKLVDLYNTNHTKKVPYYKTIEQPKTFFQRLFSV